MGTYKLLHQMGMITRERGCLRHDDRLDALAGAVRYVVEKLDFDTRLVIEARRRKELIHGIDSWKDPETRRQWLKEVCIESATPQSKRNIFIKRNRPARRTKSRNKFK